MSISSKSSTSPDRDDRDRNRDERVTNFMDVLKAVGRLSESSALSLGGLVSNWTFSIVLLIVIVRFPKMFNNDVVSDITLGIDLVLIMVNVINTRQQLRQGRVISLALSRIERRQLRIEKALGIEDELDVG